MAKELLVYIGTYTEPIRFGSGQVQQGKGKGIHIYRMDPESGVMEPAGIATGVKNPSYLAFGPWGRYLYAVNELKLHEGRETGTVSSFSLDPATGGLRFLNRRPTRGTDPCHLTVDRAGKHVFVANFMSGSVCVLPVGKDGKLGQDSDIIRFRGSSIDKARQAGPHAHAVTLDQAERRLFVPDLGSDRLMIYSFDSKRGKLEAGDPPWAAVKPGAGPRHFLFHPNGRLAFLINELDSTLLSYRYDPQQGSLREIQTVATLPQDFRGQSTCADLNVHPSGKFLYGSNRGHDSIVIYGIEEATGRLSLVGHESTRGKTPRNFAIDPSGTFLLAANQDSDSIVHFRIDALTGRLEATGQVTEVGTPVCLKFL